MRDFPTLLTSVLLSLLVLQCGNIQKEKNVLRLAISTEPPTLDPNLATDSVSHFLISNLQCGLTRYDTKSLSPKPCLAESWEYDDSGTKVVFKIKQVYWSDGNPLTSYDFVNSWRRLLDPKTGAEYSYFMYIIKGAYEFNTGKVPYLEGVTAPDPRTLVVYTTKKVVFLPAMVSFMVTYPVRLDVIEKCKERWTEPECYPEIGPFVLKEWKHEYKVVLEPNPYWFGQKPKIKRVELYVVSDPSTALNLYRSGFIDTVGLFSLAIRKFKDSPEFIKSPGLRGYYIGFNVEKLKDPNLRRALAYSTSRESIVNAIGGIQLAATSWIPPGMLAHNPNIGIPFDLEKAKVEIAKVKEIPKGLKIYFSHSPEVRKIAEVIKESWRKIGVDVELESMEWKTYLSRLVNEKFPIFLLGWGADFPDPHNFMDLFLSNSGNNHTGFANRQYDELIEKASEELDTEKRVQMYDQAQRILLEQEVAIIPTFWGVSARLKRRNLKIEYNPLEVVYLDEVEFE
ncbi:MAG: peptide ABC transporter substrate-binding protein [Candidatus Calescibacterium sp.]|nr:peptide ABC transporter substrate-binding protein [Candidatus Calescibacterium sp.]MCX7733174.1 peptide ABC transporter substrate-binding protein [bacterium]MDW8087829.1 peptide ABC transporter substrate-binding protein [Candidatus Calescibacterium sp.]